MTYVAERSAREERQNVHDGIKPILAKLSAGGRLTVEERADFETRKVRIAELNAEIKTYEEARALSALEAPATPEGSGIVPDAAEARERDFSAYLKRGTVTPELRAAGEAAGSSGGYLVPPGWFDRLQVAMKAYGGTANDFEPLETESGQPMAWATVDPTTTVGTLIGENTPISDVDYTFGQGQLGAYMFTSGVHKVSIQLANDSAFNADAFVSKRVGESLGRAQAQYAISGTGSNQPLGIVTALGAVTTTGSGGTLSLTAATKVTTLADPTGATTTELNGNILSFTTVLKLIHSVDKAYRTLGAKFYFNDTQVINEMGVTDAYGHPIWQPNVQVGQPDALYGYPVEIDNNIPNLAASTAGGPMFGHLGSAMIKRTVTQTGLLRLDQRYAELLQIAWIGYMRFDFRSNDLRAATVVKPAAT